MGERHGQKSALITLETFQDKGEGPNIRSAFAASVKITSIANAEVSVKLTFTNPAPSMEKALAPGETIERACAAWYERDADWVVAETIEVECGSSGTRETWIADYPASVPWSKERAYTYTLQ